MPPSLFLVSSLLDWPHSLYSVHVTISGVTNQDQVQKGQSRDQISSVILTCVHVGVLTRSTLDLSAILQQATGRLVVNVYSCAILTGASRRRAGTGRSTNTLESFLLHAASLWSTPGIKAHQRTDSALHLGKPKREISFKPMGCEGKSADGDRKNTQMVVSVYHGIICTELDLRCCWR